MLYSIFDYLQDSVALDFPGRHLMTYISFRAGVTFTLALLIALIFGRRTTSPTCIHCRRSMMRRPKISAISSASVNVTPARNDM